MTAPPRTNSLDPPRIKGSGLVPAGAPLAPAVSFAVLSAVHSLEAIRARNSAALADTRRLLEEQLQLDVELGEALERARARL
jgi:hypothetical protein